MSKTRRGGETRKAEKVALNKKSYVALSKHQQPMIRTTTAQVLYNPYRARIISIIHADVLPQPPLHSQIGNNCPSQNFPSTSDTRPPPAPRSSRFAPYPTAFPFPSPDRRNQRKHPKHCHIIIRRRLALSLFIHLFFFFFFFARPSRNLTCREGRQRKERE